MANLRNNPSRYVLEIDAPELSTITRALAAIAGVPVHTRDGDKERAAELNKRLLYLRLNVVLGEKKIVEDAINNLEQWEKQEGSPVR